MLELNVNYDELTHMPLEKAKEIVSLYNNGFLEDAYGIIDGTEYNVYVIDDGDWKDGGKYQYKTDIGLLCKVNLDESVTMYDIAVTSCVTRSGSYFSEYYYEYDKLEVNQVIKKTIPKQIIPERTVVTIEE